MKTIAILGKPNVGKSSLFNRLIKQQLAITSAQKGTTRDVNKAMCDISGASVMLFDTGGIDTQKLESGALKAGIDKKGIKEKSKLSAQIAQNSLKAGESADLILYVVDGGIMPQDDDISNIRKLQKAKKHLILVVNKVDNDKIKSQAWEYAAFGVECVFVSVIHNRGFSILLNLITRILELEPNAELTENSENDEGLEGFLESLDSAESAPKVIKVGIIGRVNVGKSSLLNALLGYERSMVSQSKGTTIDPVNESLEHNGKILEFVDTAGIRRASKIEGIEKFALMRTNDVLAQSHIALLLLDASEPFVELDEKISSLIPKHALGVIIVFNKWDKAHTDFTKMKKAFYLRFRFLEFAPIIAVSALSGRNITALKNEILQVFERLNFRIQTSALNDCIAKAISIHHIPSDKGKIVKIYYATQYASCPPRIMLTSNRAKSIHFSYKRYLVNALREHFDFRGVPLLLEFRDKNAAKIDNESTKTHKNKNTKKREKSPAKSTKSGKKITKFHKTLKI